MFEETNRLPPQALDVERTILGSALVSQSAVEEIVECLVADCFYSGANKIIFSEIKNLFDENRPVDSVILANRLADKNMLNDIGGDEYIGELAESMCSTSNIAHYCEILIDKMVLRQLLSFGGETVSSCFDPELTREEAVSKAEMSILSISETIVKSEIESAGDLLPKTFDEISRYQAGSFSGVRTGFDGIDTLTCGLQKSDLIIVAGRPSMGKTAFVLSLTLNAGIKYGANILIFSLEMSKSQLMQRMLCSEARVNMHQLRSGTLPKRDLPKISQVATPIHDSKIYIDDVSGATVSTIRAKSRRHKKRNGLDLVIIDYLQLMDGNGENRQQEVTKISRGLKCIAKELDVPVVALSQLSRAVENRTGNHRPQLSDLRESGAIEQDADVVMFIYRDEVYNKDSGEKGTAEIIIAKQRNGPLDTIKLSFVKDFARFENIAQMDEYNVFRGGE